LSPEEIAAAVVNSLKDPLAQALAGTPQVIPQRPSDQQQTVSCKQWGDLAGCLGALPYHSWLKLVGNSKFGGGAAFAWRDGKVDRDFQCTSDTNDGGAVKDVYRVAGKQSIQDEIRTNGPVTASLMIDQSFYAHRGGGVFSTNVTGGDVIGMHAVTITGWGREGETDYWLALNSFGKDWGEAGSVRIAMGVR
jgi:hypothetical protein